MKTIIISLAALAAISTAGFANDRAEDYNAAYRNVHFGSVDGTKPMGTDTAALAVESQDADGVSSFAQMKLRGIEHFVERGR